MPGSVKFDLTGAKEFEKLMRELGPVPAGRIGQNATMAGARVIAAEARRKAPCGRASLRGAPVYAVIGAGQGRREYQAGVRDGTGAA
jgi:hypothetical protein